MVHFIMKSSNVMLRGVYCNQYFIDADWMIFDLFSLKFLLFEAFTNRKLIRKANYSVKQNQRIFYDIFYTKELVGKKVRLRVQTCSFIFCVVIFFSHIIINVRRETAECNSYTNKKNGPILQLEVGTLIDDKCERETSE